MIPDLTIYPGLARALSNKGHAAAFMFWTLCRAVDAEGRGSIAEATVKAAALEVWTLEKYYRYRREARDLGLVRPWDNNKKHEKRLSWLGLERACRQFSVRDPGAVAVVANPSCLASAAKFKAAAFCAFQAARNSANPISRATLKELTAVGTKTQAVYEQRNNARGDGQVKAKASFMLTGYSADHLRLARQEIHR